MRKFYECGICSCIHPWDWDGDCRENAARFNLEDMMDDDELLSWKDRVAADRPDPLRDAVSKAEDKAKKYRRRYLIVRYRKQDGESRYLVTRTLSGMINRTRVGESPLLVLEVSPDGSIISKAKEFNKVVYGKSTECREYTCWCHVDPKPTGFECSHCGCVRTL